MLVSAVFWFTGFLVGSLGIATGQLWLLYLGYGILGGIGLGIGYISPVSTLIKWFPDRPGLATGMAIMGFGGGALVAAPLSNSLMQRFDGDFDPTAKGSVASTHALTMTFLTLGVIYLIFMMIGVALIRLPQDTADTTTPSPTIPDETAHWCGRTRRSRPASSGCCGSCCSAT